MAKKIEGLCQFCLETKQLVSKSHIIPKSFLKWSKNEANSITIISPEKKHWPANDFFFEGGILCEDCECKFSKAENYTFRFLDKVQNEQIHPINEIPNPVGKVLHYNVNTTPVKKCLLSILWRMSISKKDYFKFVDLGNAEIKLRNALWSDDFMKDKFFPILIGTSKHINNIKARFIKVPNRKTRIKKHDASVFEYEFLLPNFVILYYSTSNYNGSVEGLSLIENQNLLMYFENGKLTNEFYKKIIPSIPDIPRF